MALSLSDHRKARKFGGPKARHPSAPLSPLKCLSHRLLKKNVVVGSVVQENNKIRLQSVQGVVTFFRKPKTSSLIGVKREASRQITTTNSFSLRNASLVFLETKELLLF